MPEPTLAHVPLGDGRCAYVARRKLEDLLEVARLHHLDDDLRGSVAWRRLIEREVGYLDELAEGLWKGDEVGPFPLSFRLCNLLISPSCR